MNKNTLKIALAIALSGLALSANATAYTFTDLGTTGGIYTYSSAKSINSTGQIVGFSASAGLAPSLATLWNGTAATSLGVIGSKQFVNGSIAYAINNSGQVAGDSSVPQGTYVATLWNGSIGTPLVTQTHSVASGINNSGVAVGATYDTWNALNGTYEQHATIWNGTTTTILGTLGGAQSNAYGINDAGLVVGDANTARNAATHATLWNGTTATDLGTLGGNYSSAKSINSSGQVAGYATTAGDLTGHATLWNGTAATDLGTLGGTSSYANAINATGQVAGYANTAGNKASHATLWNGTTATDLNSFLNASIVSAGWVLTSATGINDNGWIVGDASNKLLGIVNHAFLMSVTPVPEPETNAMMLMGLGLMGFVARRRKNNQA